MSALSSLIIVLDVLRDKKGRDWFSIERIWKKNTDAAALWSLLIEGGSNAQSRLREQLAVGESDALLRR